MIEVAFPLKQASLDSVSEKYGPIGHITGFHLWPARRPLAASRAVLIATLLPDPGNDVERKRLLEMLGGTVTTKTFSKNVGGRKVPILKEETEGGILHWGRENGAALKFFREEIRKAYGGRTPRVLDPFAGGGAIPVEAMRLGCEAIAVDINPVAWFILKCTLEYPQRFAGQTRPLPSYALKSAEFMETYQKARGNGRGARGRKQDATQSMMLETPDADLSWHVRAWGHWVLERARRDLERFYPTVNGKATVAYLWARTVTCKNCRATIPLLKTFWLCRKTNKRFRLELRPSTDGSVVNVDVVQDTSKGGNAAQRRAYDRNVGRGTMSRSGVWCPVCGGPGTVAMTLDDVRADGIAGGLGTQLTAVVVDAPTGKEYRRPTDQEIWAAQDAGNQVARVFRDVPFGLPTEPLPAKEALGFRVPLYGFDQWYKLFTPRQLLAIGTFLQHLRAVRDAMCTDGYGPDWVEAVTAYLASALDRLVDHSTTLATWYLPGENVKHTFVRFALPITWDFAEACPTFTGGGSWSSAIRFCTAALEHVLAAVATSPAPSARWASAISAQTDEVDVILTDPPYYDAIPYSDAMDLFYVWLKRSLFSTSAESSRVLAGELSPKWNHQTGDGELIDDSSRFGGDTSLSKANYEDGMQRAFQVCHRSLKAEGRMVVVFANKQPRAWESLVSSMIRAGFQVHGSWPIQTENTTRMRAKSSAALSSSVWLVCRKRADTARPGWDTQVIEEMRANIYEKLQRFWDAGVRGPDFVWAATGPALEAYSKHPVVKKADEPNSLMTVSEFLRHVRRIVVDYVVGRILSHNGAGETGPALDDVTLYYLLHRHDFGLGDAPVGASILYAQSCSLSDRDLVHRFDLLAYGKSRAAGEAETDEDTEEEIDDDDTGTRDEEVAATSGSVVKLKRWDQRRGMGLGLGAGSPAPLVDQVHRTMQLWRTGDVQKVDAYIEDQGLRRNPVLPRFLQALIELAGKDHEPDERALLESIMNHITARGAHPQARLALEQEE